MQIKGLTVHRVLMAPAASIVEEYYFSFLLDRADRQYLCIASVEGGVEIEEVAKTNPEAVRKIAIDPGTGVGEEKARAIVAEAKFPAELTDQAVQMVLKLWQVFVEEDATLVEVNPLARLEGDVLEALDGKVSLDENADFRHPEHEAFEDKAETDPLEAKAKEKGLNYVKLDGAVGIIGNGAGPGDVDAGRGRVRRRGARWRQAGELPRHRRRRVGRGDGRRPGRDPARRAGQERLRQRLRRHHRRATRSPTASWARSTSSATRRASPSSYVSTATTSRRAGASSTSATTRW